ncbi:MAG TPA: hypothetical protein VLW17_15265, partial [Thermoanaerobaculaceae bacterium]|nr:hypothetical protein [Thermoanaerobaculaceae bacterium]
DSSGVYPIIASRSYNLTPAGTFGQNNVPLTAAMGISTSSKMQRLLITGMSSQDVQRTNFGFVNLSENNGVDFSVIFYDQSGNVLNPIDTGTGQPKPYTFALNVWGWDQDRLENRLRSLGVALPTGLQTISAVVTVRAGGPGFVYATVIDNITGDPTFIPGQLAP